jgi:hypothetical protein
MPLFTTPDGRYTYAIETPNEGDGNSVVYDNVRGVVAWDRFGYEAKLPASSGPSPPSPILIPAPAQPTSPNARVIRVTGPEDGELLNRGYAYWPQSWLNGAHVLMFCGHADGHPRFFHVDLNTGAIERLGSLVPYGGTGEGWYFDGQGRVYLTDGPHLHRYDLAIGLEEVIVADGKYPYLGTVVSRNGQQEYFPAIGDLDESSIDPSGRWLPIKEKRADPDYPPDKPPLYNRVIDLDAHVTQTLTNAGGAIGHSDMGPGYAVGEWSPQKGEAPGQCVFWDFDLPLTLDRRRTLFLSDNVGHISVRNGVCLVSDPTMLSVAALDGSGVTYLTKHGMVQNTTDPYDTQCFGNLDHTGRVAAYCSNAAGRMDLYLLIL